MAFGIDGTIVVSFLSGAFSIMMGVFNFLFTWLARHMFLLVSGAFLVSWFLTYYCLSLILNVIIRLYNLEVTGETLTLSSIFENIFNAMANDIYPFASIAFKCFDIINLSFLLKVVETLILPCVMTYFVVKFVQKIALMISKR